MGKTYPWKYSCGDSGGLDPYESYSQGNLTVTSTQILAEPENDPDSSDNRMYAREWVLVEASPSPVDANVECVGTLPIHLLAGEVLLETGGWRQPEDEHL